MSGDLTTDVNLSFDDAAGYDQTVVAVAHVEHNVGEAGEADIDMTIAYSTDGGATWSWGGTLVAPGEQWPEAVMMDPKGAIVVGWQRTRDGDETGPSQAFIAAAMAPDFVPQEIPAPAEFTGGRYVDLYDIANVDGTWVIVGTVIDDAIRSAIWRSSDEGTTWTKQVVATTGLASFAASRLVVGPDGSWNLIGAGQRSNGATFTAAWLRSADGGRTFTAVQPEAFTSDANEAALQLVLSDNGGAALLASSEAPDGGYLNALWVSNSDGVMQRLGSANLPSQEGSDLNLGGIMFFDDTLLAYGSPRGMTYGDTVQFWAMAQDGTWSPGTQVVTPATSFIKQVIIGGDTALALGLHDDGSGYDSIGVWRGSLVAPND